MTGPLHLTLPVISYFGITHAAGMASLEFDVLGMNAGLGKVDQLKAPAEPALQLGIDINSSAERNVAPTARQDVSCVRSLTANAFSNSFSFYTNNADTGIGPLTATPFVLQLYFGQPLMSPEGAKSPTSFVAIPGASAIAKCFKALEGAS